MIARGRIICQVAGKVIYLVIYGEWQVFILSGRKGLFFRKNRLAAGKVPSLAKYGQCK